MDRAPVAAVPAEIAERQSDVAKLFDAADRHLEQARENVKGRLLEGKTVNGISLRDVFDIAAQKDEGYREILAIVEAVASASGREMSLAFYDAQARAQALLERHLDSLQQEIEDESAQIAADAAEGL